MQFSFAICRTHRYVSGRTRKPGEINGKSGNLNNCLKNIIYSDYVTVEPPADATEATLAAAEAASAEVAAADVESGPAAAAAAEQQGDAGNETEAAVIPPQEVVVVFDADMACKNDFFRHVRALKLAGIQQMVHRLVLLS